MAAQAPAYALDGDGGERLRFSGAEFVVKASSELTGGAFTIIEEIAPLDTPRHVHQNEDELFYVLEGEHVFEVGEDEFHVRAGATVFAPRGVPHAHRRLVPRTGRFLTLLSPAGFEGFFRQLAEADRAGESMEAAYEQVSQKYGITWLD